MEQNLHTHIKKDTTRWIAVFIAIVILFVMVSATLGIIVSYLQDGKTTSSNVIAIDDKGTQMTESNIYEMPSTLKFSSQAMTAAAGHSVSVTLQATVLPVEAENKNVDWAVSWATADHHGTEPVTNYVTVTPKADGSNIATVTCIKAFGDDTIAITVTTREGGYTATCTVRYIGTPTSMNISTTGATNKNVSGWNKNMLEVKCGTVYNFAINLNNEFGLVGSSFEPEFDFTVVAHGAINTHNIIYDTSGAVANELDQVIDLTVADTKSSHGNMYAYFAMMSSIHSYCDIRIQDGVLIIKPEKVGSSYYEYYYSRSGNKETTFKNYVDNKSPYITVTVTENKTNLTKTFDIIVSSGVQSVNLSKTMIDI